MEGIDVSKRGKASRCNGGPLSPVVKQGNVDLLDLADFFVKICVPKIRQISTPFSIGMEWNLGEEDIRYDLERN